MTVNDSAKFLHPILVAVVVEMLIHRAASGREPLEIGRQVRWERDDTVKRWQWEPTMERTTRGNNEDGDNSDETQQQQHQRWETMAAIRDYENMEQWL